MLNRKLTRFYRFLIIGSYAINILQNRGVERASALGVLEIKDISGF
jgi:hypothetical protein